MLLIIIVSFIILQKKYHTPHRSYNDLVSAAALGMTKALNTFDTAKGIKFSTYSARCITNQIFMLMRSEKKTSRNISIDQPLHVDDSGNEFSIIDMLSEPERDIDFREISPIVNSALQSLQGQKRKIMYLFFEDKTQYEIAQIVGLSQSYVSRIVKSVLNDIKKEFWKGETKMAKLELNEYRRYKDEGLSDAQIAEKLGMSPSYISLLRKKWFKKDAPQENSAAAENAPITGPVPVAKTDDFMKTIEEIRNLNLHLCKENEDLKTAVERYQALDAASKDESSELKALKEKHNQLQADYDALVKHNHHNDYTIENQKQLIETLNKKSAELKEENHILKYFARKYLA